MKDVKFKKGDLVYLKGNPFTDKVLNNYQHIKDKLHRIIDTHPGYVKTDLCEDWIPSEWFTRNTNYNLPLEED